MVRFNSPTLFIACLLALPVLAQDVSQLDTAEALEPAELKVDYRLWVDHTGAHTVRAKLLDIRDSTARLMKESDQSIIELPFERLSLEDKLYAVNLAKEVNKAAAVVAANGLDPSSVIARRTEDTLAEIEEAERKFSAMLVDIAGQNLTTLLKEDAYREAHAEAARSLVGNPMQVHFLLDDVEQLKAISRSRKRVELSLASPDIQLDFTPESISVWADTGDTERLQRGDIIIVKGRMNSPSRRSFSEVKFYLTPTAPTPIVTDFHSSFPDGFIGADYLFEVTLNIESVSRMPERKAAEFLKSHGSMQLLLP